MAETAGHHDNATVFGGSQPRGSLVVQLRLWAE